MVEFVEIGKEAELRAEERVLIQIEDREILLIQHEGDFYALANLCSHDGEALGDADVEDGEIICPRHGARFNLSSGAATGLPAVVGVPVYQVKIEDGAVFLGISY
ncbi:MAG: Rieske 2Fe-2S domain-containing protein [Anaerolineales bacterium]|nr:Rieske 2Fe-2S domain-containing protein [Anaerolineales bacterium]